MKKMNFRILVVLVLAMTTALNMVHSVCADDESSDKPVIINHTWKAMPGDAIGIYGHNLQNGNEKVQVIIIPVNDMYSSNEGNIGIYTLNIMISNESCIEGTIPSEIPADNYLCAVKIGEQYSETFTINTPSVQWLSETEFCEGQEVRIFGKNFLNPLTKDRTKTRVWLVNTESNAKIEAQVTAASEYTLDFMAPVGVEDGEEYTVEVSNNGNNGLSTVKLDNEEAMTCLSADNFDNVKQQFGVEIGWSSQLNLNKTYNIKDYGAKGDGVTDDTTAFNLALLAVKINGGGILYMPEGCYNLLSSAEHWYMPDKIIITGDGTDKTFILTDKRLEFSKNYGGITDVTIKSDAVRLEHDSERYINGYVGGLLYGNGDNTHLFVKNVKMSVADGSSFVSYKNKHIVIEDSIFDISHSGPIFQYSGSLYDKMRIRMVNTHVNNTQRPLLLCGSRSWIENCTFEGNNAGEDCEKVDGVVVAMEHRACDLTGEKIYYGNNKVIGTIGDIRENYDDGCGEGICYQANMRIVVDEIVSANETTLTADVDFDKILAYASDSSLNLSEQYKGKYLIGAKIVIMNGDGLGQIRTITAVSGNTITVNEAWDVKPDAGDVFAINAEIAKDITIVNNDIQAKIRKGGIMMYSSSADCIIDNNNMTNSGGIWFGHSQDSSVARAEIAYYNYVANNTLSGGVPDKNFAHSRDNALYIGVGDDGGAVTEFDATYITTSHYANMYRDNVINGSGKNIEPESAYNEKFVNYNGIVLGTPSNGRLGKFSKGNILSGNKVINSVNGVYLSDLVYDTLLHNNDFTDNKKNYSNNSSHNTMIGITRYSPEVEGKTVNSYIAEYTKTGMLKYVDMKSKFLSEKQMDIIIKYRLRNLSDIYSKLMNMKENLKPIDKAIVVD